MLFNYGPIEAKADATQENEKNTRTKTLIKDTLLNSRNHF